MSDINTALMGVFGHPALKKGVNQVSPAPNPTSPPANQVSQQPPVTPAMSSKAQALAYGAGPTPMPRYAQAGTPVPQSGGVAPAASKADGWGKTV